MYVCELDRPWTDTPFMFQGFVVETPKQIETLKQYCKSVMVDTERSDLPEEPRSRAAPGAAAAAAQRDEGLAGIHKVKHPETVPVEQELNRARGVYASSEAVMRDVFAAVRIGGTLEAERIEQAVSGMAASVLRNAEALLLFARLKEKGEYTLSHALDVSVYMIAFGRFLEMSEEDIVLLGYLGLLQDIGKIRLPDQLIAKRDRLSTEEFEQAKLHVQYSVEILRATPGLPPQLARLATLHHERQDGSGYPAGLKGREIGVIGSIGAIVDTFDALTVPRPYAHPVAPSAALSMLYKWRGAFFEAQLVEQFIRCIGIFPVGSLVELNSGEVGIVIAQNSTKRLQPRVMVIRDAQGATLRPQKLLDLSRLPKVSADEPYRIRRALELGRISVTSEDLFMH